MNESDKPIRPIISLAVRSKSESDRQALQRALSALSQQDPTFQVQIDTTNGKTVISGMGELHLEIICDCLLREYRIDFDADEPGVIYLETIRREAHGEGKYIRQTGGQGQYAHVKLRIEPREPGSGYHFADEIASGAVPRRFLGPIDAGIKEAMKAGVVAGHEMVDLRAVLYDGSYHEEDSSEIAFNIAASIAFQDAARKASPFVLEPVMSVEVIAPEEFAGMIMADLSSRRGQIKAIEIRAGLPVIQALVPLAESFGYARRVRTITQGKVQYAMNFAHYEEVYPGWESGGDEAGVTADKPTRPKAGRGSTAAGLDEV